MKIIGAATGLGAQDPASGQGPDFLFENSPEFRKYFLNIIRTGQIEMNNNISVQDKINYLFPFLKRLSLEVKNSLMNKEFPVIVGGDHSSAIGTWRGLLDNNPNEVGLLWLDAHLDSHTFETTPSYAIHGMPLACLLGYGDDKFTPKKPLLPENVVIFGARSWESGEKELIDFLNVRIYQMEEINDRGIKVCLEEAISIISKPDLDFGISLDLDMFDPIMIPGVCSKEKDGIEPVSFIDIFKETNVVNMNNFKMMEIVEFAPLRDENGETFKTLKKFLEILKNK